MSLISRDAPDLQVQVSDALEMTIIPRTADIGNFEVRRVLPFRDKRMVGPFVFWDQMGPGEFLAGQGVDVRPHPHIGLSTVTYLFEGSLDHKDSLGNDQRIVPGDLNLMTAGQGIVHSERTGQDVRKASSSLAGIQSWLAQPKSEEYGEPAFRHVSAADLPQFAADGASGRLILGEFAGLASPVASQWPTLYLDVFLEPGASLPIPKEIEERALYPVQGSVEVAGRPYAAGQMLVLRPGHDVTVRARDAVRLMVLGGATMDAPRYIYWNFVASTRERLEEAKEDWRQGRFPKVPGDEKEFIPLPD
jgi:redox-sensitive bicupin YhaK (pirin superfamily)